MDGVHLTPTSLNRDTQVSTGVPPIRLIARETRWRDFPVVLAALVLMTSAGMVQGQRTDTIYPIDGGSTIRTKISDVSAVGVTAIVAGQTKTVSPVDIKKIVFGDEPVAIRQAREAIEENQLEQARQALDRVDLAAIENEFVKQEFAFLTAKLAASQAADGTGTIETAIRETLTFLKSNKNSFHFYDAMETLGKLTVQIGEFERAAKYFEALGSAPWPETKLRAAVLGADASRSTGGEGVSQAAEKYEQVIKANATSSEMRRQQSMAIVGLAICQSLNSDPQAAVKAIEELVEKTDPQDAELMARVYNGLGTAYREAEQPVDATLAYLHVDLLYFRESAAHAEALYWLTQLWVEIGKPARATEARSLLQTRYGGSPWARK